MSDFLNGKLDNQEIYNCLLEFKYPSGFKPPKKLLDDIINKFWFHDFYNSFISDPVYLEYLKKYLNDTKPNNFNRFNFYQYFFDQIVKQKNQRLALQNIALQFERLQTDKLSTLEYEKLLETIDGSKRVFKIPWMQKNHLARLEEKEGKQYFIWEHHTITEFLTAELILQDKNPIETIQELAILEQEGVVAFKPSWSGVLRFLFESPKADTIFEWFISFLNNHKDNIDDYLTELLSFIDIKISRELSKNIFDLIYNSYFDRIVWLPVWARNRLSKYVDEDSYKRLKNDIKEWSNKTETFVRRGNVISIVEGLLRDNSSLLSPKGKEFWQGKLIEFANNPSDDGNGVLQRHSLGALTYFKNEKIIAKVAQKCFEETQDTLVRDEFLQFCINTSPNSKLAIDYFIKGIKKGSNIYARHGLYKITSKKAVEYFLTSISQDEQFLKTFLEHESIFDKDGADKELIKNIENHLNPDTTSHLKKIIFSAIKLVDDYYNKDQSSFLKQIVQLVKKKRPNFIFEMLKEIEKEKDEQKINILFYDSKELISLLLTRDNIQKYFKVLKGFPERTKIVGSDTVNIAKRINGDIGDQVYRECIKLGLIKKADHDQSLKNSEENQRKRQKEIYESFVKQLEPEPGKYMPGVFGYYLQNKENIEKHWNDKDKKRLIKLVVDEGIRKIDPREFKVKILNRHEGNNKFTWSSQAAYFGDILKIVKEFDPQEINNQKQRIIDFIPYDFDTGSILDFVYEIEDKDLNFVNKVMSDKTDDRRYLIPQTYIYLVGEYAKRGCLIPSVKSILKSFINDSQIQDYNQRSALESLVYFLDKSDKKTKIYLQKIFKKTKSPELKKITNGILISVYKDKNSINWRFNQLKKPLEFDSRAFLNSQFAHEVSPAENELNSMALAKPLTELLDEKYLPLFLDLITYSFKVLEKNRDKKYWDYVNYLWRTAISFVENLKYKKSFGPLKSFENWVSKNAKDANWLKSKIRELRSVYINEFSKQKL